ncbi:EG45-like domain containing protein [Humulus lupulus]|uniref:EG45-like domain containing protein n=1 Tax=Humulus lupulus TaxID=3486 RepID=UPI002B40E4E2|nr:EG45-like domain containing protein [Humulus lupulus]
MAMRVLIIFLGLLICQSSVASGDKGTATFYTPPYLPSACNGFKEDGVMIAAASEAIWDDKGACGRRYKVRCTGATNQGDANPCRGGSIVVKIVDLCPAAGCQGTIDLSQEAFAMIADPDAGKINIKYIQV